jgi:hypothetical protein
MPIDSKGRICMWEWDPIVVWPDWYLYLESFIKNQKKSKVEKVKLLDSVYMTREQKDKLIERYGEKMTDKFIERLDNYICSKWKNYKDHYKTLLARMDREWVKKIDNEKIAEEKKTDEAMTDEQRIEARERLKQMRDWLHRKVSVVNK